MYVTTTGGLVFKLSKESCVFLEHSIESTPQTITLQVKCQTTHTYIYACLSIIFLKRTFPEIESNAQRFDYESDVYVKKLVIQRFPPLRACSENLNGEGLVQFFKLKCDQPKDVPMKG